MVFLWEVTSIPNHTFQMMKIILAMYIVHSYTYSPDPCIMQLYDPCKGPLTNSRFYFTKGIRKFLSITVIKCMADMNKHSWL